MNITNMTLYNLSQAYTGNVSVYDCGYFSAKYTQFMDSRISIIMYVMAIILFYLMVERAFRLVRLKVESNDVLFNDHAIDRYYKFYIKTMIFDIILWACALWLIFALKLF